MRWQIAPSNDLLVPARWSPSCCGGLAPEPIWATPGFYVGLLLVIGMFYGLHRWQKWGKEETERRRQERIKKFGR